MDGREGEPEGTDALRYHGGNLAVARRRFPAAPNPWIDLSTGINPLPYPVGIIAPSSWTRLPEADDLRALEEAARAAYAAPAHAAIVAAPGTQALIQWLPVLAPARRVGIVGFTYQEHAKAWRDAGADVVVLDDPSDLRGVDVCVCVNPNNPDGRVFAPERLAAAAAELGRRGGLLVVDEAFMDVLGTAGSLVPGLPPSHAVVLRSFGKAYGLPGIRLGFAMASCEWAGRLRTALGPWAVSGPAIEIASRALRDRAWLAATVSALQERALRLDGMLTAVGFAVVGGTPLFRLAQDPRADLRFDRLCRAGILTRPFRQRPDWLRFGIPETEAAWGRLAAALG
jgi:cobalamin biosynthetic protein CobC